MTVFPPDYLCSLSAFEGLIQIKEVIRKQSKFTVDDAVAYITKNHGTSFNLQAAKYLHSLTDFEYQLDPVDFYRKTIIAIFTNDPPDSWLRSVRSGRRRFVNGLDINVQNVFTFARLLENPPSKDTVAWWDTIAGYAYSRHESIKMQQGRYAEQLTIEHEKGRLKEEGIDRTLAWPGLDDNYAGYDILSYNRVKGVIVPYMIEVKSTIMNPLSFYISRNEWEQANQTRPIYAFYIWDMKRKELHVRQADEIAKHIPCDNNNGKWISVQVKLS